jgi:hypothetical protein
LARTAVFAVSTSVESSDPELTTLADGESELPGTTPLVLSRLRPSSSRSSVLTGADAQRDHSAPE